MPSSQIEYPLTLAEVLFEELEATSAAIDETRTEIVELRFYLKQIRDLQTEDQLTKICGQEEISIDPTAETLVEKIWDCRTKLSQKLVPLLYEIIRKLPEMRSALCLSGGGAQNADLNLGIIQALIRAGPEAPHLRSATFNLGVLQGLARCGLLDKFDYLSTVSGGGFIGSWLTAWIHREGGNIRAVAHKLASSPEDPLKPEPEPLYRVRVSAKYLSPAPGLFSMDKFTLLAVYFINLILNWLVFVPVIMAVLMLPRIWVTFVKSSDSSLPFFSSPNFFLAIGFVGAAIALVYIGTNLPGANQLNLGETKFDVFCLLPLVLSAMALTTYWARLQDGHGPAASRFIYFALLLGGIPWALYVLLRFISFLRYRKRGEDEVAIDRRGWSRAFLEYVGATGLIMLAFAAPAYMLWYALSNFLPPPLNLSVGGARGYASWAVPVLLLLLTLGGGLTSGLTSRFTDVNDQEWWWRLSARFFVVIGSWILLHLLVLFGPTAYRILAGTLLPSGDWTPWDAIKGIGTLIGVVSGAIALFGGFKSKSSPDGDDGPSSVRARIISISMNLSSTIWAALIVISLSVATDAILASHFFARVVVILSGDFVRLSAYDHVGIINLSPGKVLAVMTILMGVCGWIFGRLININRISLHFYWRNRIMRAFLGASRDRRHTKNMLTDFDPRDNLQMHELKQRPLHLINVTLNRGSRTHKRNSFTVSPLHSGSYPLGYRDSRNYGGSSGISLATSAAVSAAGVSPGASSAIMSPVMRFIMIFLNVRLGFWLGNPGIAGGGGPGRFKLPSFNRDSPAQAVRPIFAEALGLTNARSPYVYLSDGGHFENLGLYEMVLRRCHFIVVSDASTDPGYRYQSLGQAIRQIRVDLGVPIEMEKMAFGKDLNADAARENRYCAIGRIRYSAMDNLTGSKPDHDYDGVLIYIKPSLNGSEPRDVVNYHNENNAFPQDSIANKEFGDEQFESYRMLGSHMIQSIGALVVPEELSPFQRFKAQARLHQE
ncbi:MAG: hypothetical protein AABM67_10390 [Acidobacteriota bacterium]